MTVCSPWTLYKQTSFQSDNSKQSVVLVYPEGWERIKVKPEYLTAAVRTNSLWLCKRKHSHNNPTCSNAAYQTEAGQRRICRYILWVVIDFTATKETDHFKMIFIHQNCHFSAQAAVWEKGKTYVNCRQFMQLNISLNGKWTMWGNVLCFWGRHTWFMEHDLSCNLKKPSKWEWGVWQSQLLTGGAIICEITYSAKQPIHA